MTHGDEHLDLVVEKVECIKCGHNLADVISWDQTGFVKCPACGTPHRLVVQKTIPKLVTRKGNKDGSSITLCHNKIIGRGDPECSDSERGYIKVISDGDESLEENTWARNPFVSHRHAKIVVKEELEAERREEGLGRIFAKRVCYIKDLDSRTGTSVNDHILEHGELRKLHHNDRIVLAPNSTMPTTLVFREE